MFTKGDNNKKKKRKVTSKRCAYILCFTKRSLWSMLAEPVERCNSKTTQTNNALLSTAFPNNSVFFLNWK